MLMNVKQRMILDYKVNMIVVIDIKWEEGI